jgi:hypothetical protein
MQEKCVCYIYFITIGFEMDPFFLYVSIGALVILILILTLVGVSLTQMQSMDSFPPTQNTCPDYWDVSLNPAFCGIPTDSNMSNKGYLSIKDTKTGIDKTDAQNIGMCKGPGFGCNKDGDLLNIANAPSSNNFQYVKLNNNTSWSTLYPGITERCAKKNWAQTLNISWDGVTNYNGC